MKGWLAHPSPGASESNAAREKLRTTLNPEDVTVLLTLLSKMCLDHAQRLRTIEGCLFKSYRLKTDSAYIAAANAAHQSYKARVKDNPLQGLGSPAAHIWAAVVMHTINVLPVDSSERATVSAYAETCSDPTALSSTIFFVKVGVMFERDWSKLQFYVSKEMDSVFAIIHSTLLKQEAQYMPGASPMSGLERDLQKQLDRLS